MKRTILTLQLLQSFPLTRKIMVYKNPTFFVLDLICLTMLLVKKPAKNIVLTAHKRNLVQKSKINTKNVIKTALKLKLPNLSKPRGSVHCLSFLKKRLQIVK